MELLRVQISDLADKQLISKFKKGFRLLLCVNDAYSKYAWVIPLKIPLQLLVLLTKFSLNQTANQIKYRQR